MDKVKQAHLSANTSQNFSLVCLRFWPPQDQPRIFCRLFQCRTIILFGQNIKISSLCQNLPWSKTASLCQNADDPHQPKTTQNSRLFRELNNVTLAEQPLRVIRQTLVLTSSLSVECRGARRNFIRGGLKFWEKYFALTKVQATLFTITFMSYILFQF